MYPFKPIYEKAIILPDKSKLGHTPLDPMIFLDRSTVYYGASGTGKSTAIREQLKLLENLVSRVVCFTPTNDVNETYTDAIPSCVINKTLSREKIEKIFEEQEKKAAIYTEINKIEMLKDVFNEMRNITSLVGEYYTVVNKIKVVDAKLDRFIRTTNARLDLNYGEKLDLISSTKNEAENSIKEIYRIAIRKNSTMLTVHLKDEILRAVVQNIDYNPRLLLIMDDCIDDIVAICSKSKKSKTGDSKPSIMDTIFSRGRWAYITIIIAAQDDVKLIGAIRKNTYVSIFTDAESAQHYMENKTNAITKQKKVRANMVIDAVFNSKGEKNFKKLVYYRLGEIGGNMFTYKIAEKYDKIKVGSPHFWAICDRASKSVKDKREVLRGLIPQNKTNNCGGGGGPARISDTPAA